ncbi:MAG: tol-pal system protein YbgF [candidate division KSB1 bacterium]|nr:tol-pal system protein YbgF [candidate division KSB1 bacterium]MDZ7303033.1 tol-pal system protein YbgF [candidate division KSB1 bacterium]MDZ7312459.1 tol-pal system protein YbgF [candidate division KSB1 bacterium]
MRHSSLFLFLSLFFLPACATRKEIVNLKKDTAFLRTQLDSLRNDQQYLGYQLNQLQFMTVQAADSTQRWRADMRAQLDQIAKQNEFLNGRLDEMSRRISNLPAKLRLATSTAGSTPPATNKVSPMDTATANLRLQFPGSVRLYEAAYQDLVKGHYQQARESFMLYLRFLPQGELADDAQYWIGESYNGEGQIEKALQAFQNLISNYPESDRVPLAMLKLANHQIALGQTNAGKKTLETLLERFPKAKEAPQALSRLRELQN